MVKHWGIFKRGERVDDYVINDKSPAHSFLFVDCHIRNIKLLSKKNPKIIVFYNCEIYKLKVWNCTNAILQIINCKLNDSFFSNSTLPTLTFSNELNTEFLPATLAKNPDKFRKDKKMDCLMLDCNFSFCNLNQLKIKKYKIINNDLKHCYIDDSEFEEVELSDLNIRGTKFFNTKWIRCKIKNISFSKERFLLEFIEFFILFFSRTRFLKLIHYLFINLKIFWRFIFKGEEFLIRNKSSKRNKVSQDWKELEKKMGKNFILLRSELKNKLGNGGSWFCKYIIDRLSSTLFKENVLQGENTIEDKKLQWYFEEQNFAHRMKEEFFAFSAFAFIFAGHFRSFFAVFVRAGGIILLYTFYYLCCANIKLSGTYSAILKNGSFFTYLKTYFLLSIKLFIGENIPVLEVLDFSTEMMIFLEALMGYLYLGILVAMVTQYIYRKVKF